MNLWITFVVLGLVAIGVVTFFWRSTRIPVNRDADHDSWKRPDQGGGVSGD